MVELTVKGYKRLPIENCEREYTVSNAFLAEVIYNCKYFFRIKKTGQAEGKLRRKGILIRQTVEKGCEE